MSELTRPARTNGQLTLTRGHLYAFGAMSLTLAILAFFVGLQVGRGPAVPTQGPVVRALLDDEARTGDLETLLMRVESARAPDGLVFPRELPKSAPPLPPVPVEGEVPVEAAPLPPVDPVAAPDAAPQGEATLAPAVVAPSTSDGVPTHGWAIQVAVRNDAADADRLVATLREAKLDAYRVEALVDGRSEHRVRIGGYATEAAATAALPEVRGRAGASTATVAHAP